MKNKSKKLYLKFKGMITFLLYITFCLCAYVNRNLSACLLLMLLCSIWAILMYWMQSRINDKLAQHNAVLMKQNDDLSKLCDDIDKDRATRRIISYFYLYKYLNVQNDVDFCKRKINCTDYLSKKRWLEFMIETYTGILKERGQNV